MSWVKPDGAKYFLRSDQGYTVAAIKVRGEWVFQASTPKRSTVYHRDGRITTGDQEHRTRYDKGEALPTTTDRLGIFRASEHANTDAARAAAKAACQAHFDKALAAALAGPPQQDAVRTREPAGFAL